MDHGRAPDTAARAPEPPTFSGPPPELVERAVRGDAAAFTELYDCCAPGLRRYVRSMVWNAWDAEDVTQDALVKIFVGISRYDATRAPFSAWMLRVARNAAIDHLRRQRGRPAADGVDECTAALDDAGQQCGQFLRDVLQELPPSQREILMLRAFGGFTPPEVARQVKRSRGSINTLYHRARLAAKASLLAMDAAPSTRTAREPVAPKANALEGAAA
jgi:RNA polymerase sigma-70 factor (ECF subfamily)